MSSSPKHTPSSDPPAPDTGAKPPRRLLLHGEAAIASAGISLATILLAAMAGVGCWTLHEQATAAELTLGDRVRGVAASMAPAVEALMAEDDLSAVRRVVVDTARTQSLSRCRIVLPDGQVVAASAGERVTAINLPAKWTEKMPPAEMPAVAGVFSCTQMLQISGRGVAFIEVAANLPDQANRRLESLTAIGAIGAAAMFGVLITYRRMRGRLRGMSAVREALLNAYASGQNGAVALANPVSADLGPEAAAWNALVGERELVRRDARADRARESLGRRRQPRGDLDAACDAMSQGLVLIDDQGRVRYSNGAAAAFLRISREKLNGANVKDVIAEESVQAVLHDVVAGTSRRRAVVDVEHKEDTTPGAPTGGAAGVLRFSVRPVRREDSASAMIIIEDITQQKAAEEARHAFVAQATHELRTPLTNIRLYVETAIEDGDTDPAIRTQALNVINSEARRLERIVGEMLSVAEIEAGSFKLNADDVRLDSLFDEVRRDYQAQAKEKGITFSFVLPPKLPVLVGDRDKVTIALHNLVGNALKYTKSGGTVTVRVEADEKQLAIAIADTGIGIAPADCERVFERFYRANDERVARITGTGLGLTIAREVARLHGGDVTLESQLNHGSTFTLTLPVKAAA